MFFFVGTLFLLTNNVKEELCFFLPISVHIKNITYYSCCDNWTRSLVSSIILTMSLEKFQHSLILVFFVNCVLLFYCKRVIVSHVILTENTDQFVELEFLVLFRQVSTQILFSSYWSLSGCEIRVKALLSKDSKITCSYLGMLY